MEFETDVLFKNLSYNKSTCNIELNIKLNTNETISEFLLVNRKTKKEYPFKHANNSLLVSFLDLVEDGVYDFFIKVYTSDNNFYLKRVGNYKYYKEILLKDKYIYDGNNVVIISPKTTYKAKKLYITKTTVNQVHYKILKKGSHILDTWLITEQPTKAQDNGYYFFKYCRENHSDMPIYYVINEDSIDYEKVAKLGNVIIFGTKQHYELLARAKYLITTHHDTYLFPYESRELKKKIKAKRIFLQHGVMGTKYMANFYGKYAQDFRADMFVVSSVREKEMIVNDFKYKDCDVKVTGLARFDNLFVETKNDIEIAIIPTWRDWLVQSKDFENSEYFIRYTTLIKTLKKNKFKITFVLHINMAPYKQYFKDLGVDVLTPNECDVQDIMKRSKLLITDYSSVGFDFSFLNKPVIYYQFDSSSFYGENGSHYDINTELPGYIVSNENTLLKHLIEYRSDYYNVCQNHLIRSNNLIKYRDTLNSKRIYDAILTNDYGSKKLKRNSVYVTKIYNFYRRTKIYFPTMKLMYSILKYLPKKNIVLIECSNGQNISDSPREIYNSWSTIDENQKFIFSYNYVLPHKYSHNSKAVKRLSPSYFYYMARSKVWINNQNFPFYFKNHKTLYIQTWHGTPIKKMLHDLDKVVGRDSGYVSRVTKATKQWSYLISPSAYATACFKSAFKYECETLEVGYPRNDLLVNETDDLKNAIIETLGIDITKKVILFAPTFRDDAEKIGNKFYQDLNIDYIDMYKKLAKEYTILLKLHPLAILRDEIPKELGDFIIDVSGYSEINELFLVSDMLITDYSSVMFDYLLTNKKTILYAYDQENYEFNNRGFYLDYNNDAPGVVISNYKDLVREIKNIDIPYDINNYKSLYAKQGNNVSKEVVEFILGELK